MVFGQELLRRLTTTSPSNTKAGNRNNHNNNQNSNERNDHKNAAAATATADMTSSIRPMTKEEAVLCDELLAESEMFQKLTPGDRKLLVDQMMIRNFQKKEVLLQQDEPSDRFFLTRSGEIRRTRIDPDSGKKHIVEFLIQAKSINSMRIISGEPSFSTVKCVTDHCQMFEMTRDVFLKTLHEKPEITTAIAEALCEQLRKGSKTFATPLLEQQQQEVNVPAVAIAAGIESYYRSGLNAKLNERLTGVKGAGLFPNMHVQVPVRISYITGFKALRSWLDHTVQPDAYDYPTLVRLTAAVAPGIIMTPISSVLEASNAGHLNNEPLQTRWMRGIAPRGGREIIFGVGLNQLSDFFEERLAERFFPSPSQSVLANAAGSLAAGVVSGYLSHVPHNMSTFKLLEPHRPYGELYRMFVDKSVPPKIEALVSSWSISPGAKQLTRTVFATLFPKGLMIRTTQIVGSFVILNGTINYLQLREHHKIQRAIAG
jgi:hypothetical protein